MSGLPMGLQAIDTAMLVVLGISAAVGVWRGFVFEVMALAGWVVAYLGAQKVAPWAVASLWPNAAGSDIQRAAVFLGCFVALLLTWALLARLLRALVRATPLAWPDRAVGGVFGLVRGVLILLVVATLVALSPWRDQSDWRASRGRVWLERLHEGLRPFLPAEAARWLRVHHGAAQPLG